METTSVIIEMSFVDCLNIIERRSIVEAQAYIRSVRHQIVKDEITIDLTYVNGETGTITLPIALFLGDSYSVGL